MHEQSETIQGRDNRYYNVYGQGTGASQPMPLPKVFGFEQPSYITESEARNKAAWRSQLGEGHYATSSPQYGFSNSYTVPPPHKAIGDIVTSLVEWARMHPEIGFPGAGALRGPRFLQPIGHEMGGFNVPTSQMRRDMGLLQENRFKYQPPTGERFARDSYMSVVDALNQGAEQYPKLVQEMPHMAENPMVQKTIQGRNLLNAEMQREMGGQELPPEMYRRLGFGKER